MAESLSPSRRAPTEEPDRLQSPTTPFSFISNDDQLSDSSPPSATPDPCLSTEQIMELYRNCIKLASENKINRKNTWELKLIDHLSEILKVAGEADAETNFRKASCTLEAGVMIYSIRVDSVHAKAYKVLAGINRACCEYEKEHIMKDECDRNGQDGSTVKKELDEKISPLSTLESSSEALNAKKFDAGPVFHQTSAQLDEGGAKGLLLNNLGIYGRCQVLFDSFEVPGKCRSSLFQNDTPDMNHMIDISFAKEFIEQMLINMRMKKEISPTLREIISQCTEDIIRSSETYDIDQESGEMDDASNDNGVELDGTSFRDYNKWCFDHDERTANESSTSKYPSLVSYNQKDPYLLDESDAYDKLENVSIFLFQRLGLTSKQNTWAGPEHWKYWKPKGEEKVRATESGSASITKKSKTLNMIEIDTCFLNYLEREVLDIFSPPKNPKSLLLANREPCCNTLPEDCHYQPEDLVKLFLLPNCVCLGRKRRQGLSDNSWLQKDDFNEALPSWDNESIHSCRYDDAFVHVDVENSDELISQPCQVKKIEVHYDKSSEQIDVRVLKETLWGHMNDSYKVPATVGKDVISFQDVLATLPANYRAASSKIISPHLFFVCLLHLANEHSLIIRDCPNLDDLTIQLPSPIPNL